MRRKVRSIALAIGLGAFVLGCATTSNLPMTANINDYVTLGTDTNILQTVAFEYESKISDGIIKPCEKDRGPEQSSHPGYRHTESTTLERMLNEYMSHKFFQMNPDAKIRIKVTLTDFWIEQYLTDNTGKVVKSASSGGEVSGVCLAKVKVLVTINRSGVDYSEILVGSADETHVSGFGTEAQRSYRYKGKESVEHTHAKNINQANNEVLVLMNRYFENMDL